MSTPRLDLEDYGLSRSLGFLSNCPPSTSFSVNRFSQWDTLIRQLSELISSKSLRRAVHRLPLLDARELSTEADQRRAYVVLGFLIHGYVWMDLPHDIDITAAIIPPQLAEPFLVICNILGMQPVLSYAGLCLWNWSMQSVKYSPDSKGFDLEHLTSVGSFTGTRGEDAFYHAPVLIEAEGGPLVSLLLDALQSAQKNDVDFVTGALHECAETIVRMKGHLPKLYSMLDADLFYRRLRPFLSGGKGMESHGLPQGFVFERSDGSCLDVKCVGGSAAQSSLFQYLDMVLGVNHEKSGNDAESLFEVMRSYMPGQHRQFLRVVSQQQPLRVFVEKSNSEALRRAYDECLKQLRQWRSSHIAVVSKYIIRPAKSVDSTSSKGRDVEDDTLTGTAGSALIPFLKQTRDETRSVRH